MEPLQSGDPQQVGAYQLVARLGAGGMGQVFLGESPGGRKVAIKVLHAQYAADGEFRLRFAREVAAARRVGGFHTAPVVDADPGASPPWMATAYIAGPSLAVAVGDSGPLSPAAVRQAGAALAEGLAAIHACGLVHRDLKPANIILADDGPRIIDFGIARSTDSAALTSSGVVVGTVAFMSPEQVSGGPVDQRSDVFSLGSVLGFAAAGQAPFDGPSIPAIAHNIASRQADLEGIDPGLAGIIAACLAKDPAQRPSAASLIGLLSGRWPASAPVAAPQGQEAAGAVRAAGGGTLVAPAAAAHPGLTAPAQAAGLPPAIGLPAGAGLSPAGGPLRATPARPAWRRRPRLLAAVAALIIAAAAGLSVDLAVSSSPGHPAAQAGGGPAALPARYTGRWHGTLRNLNSGLGALEGNQAADLTLSGGTAGTVIGTASYPDVGCQYKFRLLSVRAHAVTIFEMVDTGVCVSEYLVLTPGGGGLDATVYASDPAQGGPPSFSGHLTRAGSRG